MASPQMCVHPAVHQSVHIFVSRAYLVKRMGIFFNIAHTHILESEDVQHLSQKICTITVTTNQNVLFQVGICPEQFQLLLN